MSKEALILLDEAANLIGFIFGFVLAWAFTKAMFGISLFDRGRDDRDD